MILFNTLFRFYIQSSIHVALAVTAFVGVTVHHFGLSLNSHLFLFILFGAITGYNFVKYAGVANLYHLRRTKYLQVIRLFSVFSFLATLYYAFQLPVTVLLTAGAFGSLTILYALPVFKKTNLRSLTGIKIYIIALVWAGSTVILPLVEAQHFPFNELLIEFIQRFLFVIVLMLPFEIRDLKYDVEELRTIPQILGVPKTRWFGVTLLLFIVLLNFLKPGADLQSTLIFVFISTITALFIIKSKVEQPEYYASFWVESIPLLWWVVLNSLS